MKHGDVIEHENVGEKFYILYDETDTSHCIPLGEFKTLKETVKRAKEHKKIFPEAVVQAYEMIREE